MASREETASSSLSLEAEINQFHFKEKREEQGEQVVQVSDSKDELDRVSVVHPLSLVVAHIDNSLEDEKEEMALN